MNALAILAAALLLQAPAAPPAQSARTAPPAFSVEDAVRAALKDSPRIREARFGAEAAQAQTDRDKPVARPTVTTMGEARYQGPRVTFPRAGDGDATFVRNEWARFEVNVEQVLYHAGAGAARTRYQAQSRANGLDVKRQANDLAHDVRHAYYALLTAQAGADTARQGVDLAQKHLDLTKLMLQAGTAADRDVKASDADLAEAQQADAKAQGGVVLARGNLNMLMGREPSTPLTTAPEPPLPTIPDTPDGGIAQALRDRPELLALEEGIRAARAGATLAGTQNTPTLSARATAAAQTPTALNADHYFAAGLVVTWNPFDTAQTQADVRTARAKVGQLEAQLDEARLGIRMEVERAWQDMKTARAALDAADRQVASARAAYDVSELRYQVRSATQLEVSGALLNVTKAQMNRVQATNDLRTAWADWLHAIGADAK